MVTEYTIQTMKDINKIKHNGLNVISTFSGCGGSCLGYKMAGYKVLWANEFIPEAQEVYRLNFPDTILNTSDIRNVAGIDILKAINMKKGEVDIMDGSPPCASFSTAGAREKGWGKVKQYSSTKQRTDDLFYEYVRILREIMPKVFIAENVSGLVKGTAKGYFLEILKSMKEAGYNVTAKLLNAKYLGVPQSRERIIFIGVRKDLNKQPEFPKPLDYIYKLKDAFKNLPDTNIQEGLEREKVGKKYAVHNIILKLPKNPYKVISGSSVMNGSYFNLIRTSYYQPSPTVCQTGGGMGMSTTFHPEKDRKFTISELKRVFSFPDDFILTGTFQQQWERIARTVPPKMMYYISDTIRRSIFNER